MLLRLLSRFLSGDLSLKVLLDRKQLDLPLRAFASALFQTSDRVKQVVGSIIQLQRRYMSHYIALVHVYGINCGLMHRYTAFKRW